VRDGAPAPPLDLRYARRESTADDSERTMLRWTVPFLIVIAAIGPAAGADESVARQGKPQARHRHAGKLPAGLPRPHSEFRTTIAHEAPYASRQHYARPLYADETSELLFTPTDVFVRRVLPFVHAPVLPGSSTLPGDYGSSHSYDYQGPYYGGPNPGLWDRLPYACGVYGYC
jgi:hypothetical protein